MTTLKFYRGHAETNSVSVVDIDTGSGIGRGTKLRRRDDLFFAGRFAWGGEIGSLQLAVALLADALGDDRKAVALMQPFRDLVIAGLPAGESWIMSDNVVRALAASIGREAVPA